MQIASKQEGHLPWLVDFDKDNLNSQTKVAEGVGRGNLTPFRASKITGKGVEVLRYLRKCDIAHSQSLE